MVQEEQSKQKQKLGRLELGSSVEALSAWCQRIPQLKKYVPLFETRGVTGERMRATTSDQELEDLGMALWIRKKIQTLRGSADWCLGMVSELDRCYLRLQLARIRAHITPKAAMELNVEAMPNEAEGARSHAMFVDLEKYYHHASASFAGHSEMFCHGCGRRRVAGIELMMHSCHSSRWTQHTSHTCPLNLAYSLSHRLPLRRIPHRCSRLDWLYNGEN